MTRLILAEAFETIVQSAVGLPDLFDALSESSEAMGFRYFALTHHVDFASAPDLGIRLHNYPAHWEDWFDERALGRFDPIHRASHVAIAARLAGPCHAPKIIVQSVSRDNLHSLVTGDQLSVTAGPRLTADNDMVFREVHDAFGPTRLDHSLHWREENDNPALARFLLVAARRYGRPPPGRPSTHQALDS